MTATHFLLIRAWKHGGFRLDSRVALSRNWKRSPLGSWLFPALALALIFSGWLAVYAYDKGFSKKWRKFIREEFRERGLELDFSRLTIDPLQGLVARDVDVYDSRKRLLRIASITGLKIDADLIKVVSGRSFINSVDLDDVDLMIPLDPDDAGGEAFAVSHLSARAYFRPDRIEVRRVTARIGGVDVEIAGTLPLTGEATGDEEDSRERAGIDLKLVKAWQRRLAHVKKWLERIEFDEGSLPKLLIRLEGDPADPGGLRGNLRLVTGGLRVGQTRFDSASAVLDFRDEEFLLRSVELRDGVRRIEAFGRYSLDKNLASFRVDGDANLPGLVSSFMEDPGLLGQLVYYDAPYVQAQGRWDFSQGATERIVFGHFHCDRFNSRGVLFGGSMDFSIAPERFFIRNFRLEHQSGNLTLQCLKDEESFRYDATLRMDPSALVPFVLKDGMRNLLQSFSMGRDSGVHLEISGEGQGLDSRTWSSRGHFDLRDFEFRGTYFDRAEADLKLDGLHHHYENVRVARPEGSARGERVSVDYGNGKRTELVGVEGNLDLGAVIRCFNQATADRFKVYRFGVSPDFEIAGTIAGKGQAGQSDLLLKFRSDEAASTELMGKTWDFSKVGGDVRISGTGVDVDVLGSIFGGELRLVCTLANGITRGQLQTEDLDFDQVVEFLGGSGESGGKLDLGLVFETHPDKKEWFDAEGAAQLADADIFAIPFLGPLSPIISAILPGGRKIGYGVANSASVDFVVEKGVLETDSFEALSPAFRLGVKGQVDLRNMEVAADATMNLKGAAGILLSPVSKLLEFRATGNVKDPRWVPTRLVRPLGGRATLD